MSFVNRERVEVFRSGSILGTVVSRRDEFRRLVWRVERQVSQRGQGAACCDPRRRAAIGFDAVDRGGPRFANAPLRPLPHTGRFQPSIAT